MDPKDYRKLLSEFAKKDIGLATNAEVQGKPIQINNSGFDEQIQKAQDNTASMANSSEAQEIVNQIRGRSR